MGEERFVWPLMVMQDAGGGGVLDHVVLCMAN